MTATLTRDMSLAATPASDDLRNALQLLLSAECGALGLEIDREGVIAVNRLLRRALAKAEVIEAKYAIAADLIKTAEAERLMLVDELREQRGLLRGFEEVDRAHIYVDWPKRLFRIERSLSRSFASWPECLSTFREVRRARIANAIDQTIQCATNGAGSL